MYVSEDTFDHLRQAADERLRSRARVPPHRAGARCRDARRPPRRGLRELVRRFRHAPHARVRGASRTRDDTGRGLAASVGHGPPVPMSEDRGTMGTCEPRSALRSSAGRPTSTRSATPTPTASRARPEPCWSAARRASARPASWASSCGRSRRTRSCCAASPSTSIATRRRTHRSSPHSGRSRRRSARRRSSRPPDPPATRSPCCCPT